VSKHLVISVVDIDETEVAAADRADRRRRIGVGVRVALMIVALLLLAGGWTWWGAAVAAGVVGLIGSQFARPVRKGHR
jgi:hypothetical protein